MTAKKSLMEVGILLDLSENRYDELMGEFLTAKEKKQNIEAGKLYKKMFDTWQQVLELRAIRNEIEIA